MGSPSLVVVAFGDNRLTLRRRWGSEPEIVGRQVLNLLAEARAIKPRRHFHTGSWLVRLLMAEGDAGGTSLPTFEVDFIPDGMCGDWDRAYFFKAVPAPVSTDQEEFALAMSGNTWVVGYVERATCLEYSELEERARWFTEEEFLAFVDEELRQGLASGRVYTARIPDNSRRGAAPRHHG